MKPQIRPRPGGYEFVWEEDAIAIRLERLREKSDTISAEISVYETPLNEDNPLLMGVRSNLMSDAAPGRLAKRLSARKNNVRWPDLVEAAFASTIREYRRSSPVIHIGQLPARATPKWRLEPILLDGHINLIFGDGGVGKTTIAELFAICVQQGWGEPLGLRPEKGAVLFGDYEQSSDDANEILKALEAGLSLPAPDVIYRRGRPPILAEMEEIQTIVQQHDIKLVVVDSIVRACGGEKEAKENASPTIDALATLGITVLLISHIPKETSAPRAKTAYGSVFFWNGPRMIWEMRKEQEVGEDILDIALFNRKSNRTRLHAPLGYRLQFDPLFGIKVERRDVAKMSELGKGISLRLQIRELLSRGPLSAQGIAEELEAELPSVKVKLSQGKRDGWFIDLPGKPPLWGLATKEEC